MVASSITLTGEIELGENVWIESKNGEKVAVEPSSIDLHLGPEILRPKHKKGPVIVDEKDTYPEYEQQDDFTIPPHSFRLAHTDEIVGLSNKYVGILHGRSSVGRLGLFIENAGLIDAGFHGQVTLELTNPTQYPITLKEGMRICQMTVHKHEHPPNVGYSKGNGNKYNGQEGATPSRLYRDFE